MKVVELASYVSGPLATMMVADLGAEVIKVEPPKGDPFRRDDPQLHLAARPRPSEVVQHPVTQEERRGGDGLEGGAP
jgi:crotonobetainyl-CoA:carnitine CoA-transferase CaiB-like acyl-CoA transferase